MPMPSELGNPPASQQPLSRRVYVGLGKYGALVAAEIRRQLDRKPAGPNQLTMVLDFQVGSRRSRGSTVSRRAVHDKFMADRLFATVYERIDEAVNLCSRMPRVRATMRHPRTR